MKSKVCFLAAVVATFMAYGTAFGGCYAMDVLDESHVPPIRKLVLVCETDYYPEQVLSMVQFDRQEYYLVLSKRVTQEGTEYELYVTDGWPGKVIAQSGFFGEIGPVDNYWKNHLQAKISAMNDTLQSRIKGTRPWRQGTFETLLEGLHLSTVPSGVAISPVVEDP
ncbi:MAG: hypothetical protein ACYC7J_18320 [Syntrophales bacterium]